MTLTKQQEFDILAAELKGKVEGLTVELFDYLYPEFAEALRSLHSPTFRSDFDRVIIREDLI